MTPKLSKEEEKRRREAIDAGISVVGLKRLEYRGKPTALRSWERRVEARRLGNRSKDLADRGRGSGSAGARHIAKEGE